MLNRRSVACAVFLRLALYTFLYFSMGIAHSGTGLLGKRFGEEEFYFDSISNLISHGQYNYTLNYMPGYAGRMPGYGLVYGIFKIIFPNSVIAGYNGVIVMQLLLGTVAMIYLAKILFTLTKDVKLCSVFLIVYALSAYSIQTDMFLFTESFAASALIFSTYCFLQGLSSDRLFYYFLSGCWLSWVVFLRPFMLPFFGVWLAIYAYYQWHHLVKHLRRFSYTSALFVLPFLVPDAAWTIRNWTIYHQLVPLQTQYAGMQYSDLFLESRSFASALGEEPVVWSPHSLLTWLTRPTAAPETAPRPWQLTKHGTYDSLVWLRSQILISKNNSLPVATRIYSEKQAVSALRRFRVAFINEHPFIYYIIVPLRLTYYLALTDSGASVFAWPFNELAVWQKIIRLYFSATHWFWMCAGLFSFFCWPRHLNIKLILIRLAPIYLIILFVLIVRHVEYRYFFLVYPFTLLSGFHAISQLAKRVAPQLFAASK
jgi:hypothetical protein